MCNDIPRSGTLKSVMLMSIFHRRLDHGKNYSSNYFNKFYASRCRNIFFLISHFYDRKIQKQTKECISSSIKRKRNFML
jgi:hypothetical protein